MQESAGMQLQAMLREAELALAAERAVAASMRAVSPPPGAAAGMRNASPLAPGRRTLSHTSSMSSWDGTEGVGAMRWELACLHGDAVALSHMTLTELQGWEPPFPNPPLCNICFGGFSFGALRSSSFDPLPSFV
jgi:hypothetical protein